MQEWERILRRENSQCEACARRSQDGDAAISALEWSGGAFLRRDLCAACASGSTSTAFATWKRRIGIKNESGPPKLDVAYLTEFLKRLDRETDVPSRRMAYIVALLLIRRRALEQLPSPSENSLRVRLRKEEREFTIEVPVLDGPTVAAIEEDLAKVFKLEPAV